MNSLLYNTDSLSDLTEVGKNKFVKFNVPNDFVRGVLSKIFFIPDQFAAHQGDEQAVYEIKAKYGQYHETEDAASPTLIGEGEYINVGGKTSINDAMRKIKVGQELAIIFTGTKPAKIKGHHAAKTFAIKAGGMDPNFEPSGELEHPLIKSWFNAKGRPFLQEGRPKLTPMNSLSQPEQESNLQAALKYLELGYSVFPIIISYDEKKNKFEKKPLVREFQLHKADKEQIEKWFTQFQKPNVGIGIATGKASGFVAVDVEAGGDMSGLPHTVMLKTISGGHHLYYKWPGFYVKNSVKKIRPLMDIRGEGGFVVAPPTCYETGQGYEWIVRPEDADLADLPDWLLKQLMPQALKAKIDFAQTLQEKVSEGSRNDTAAKISGRLLYYLPDDLWELAGWPAMQKWNSEQCQPPLEEKELREVWNSIAKKELQSRTEDGINYQEDESNKEWKVWTAADILTHEFGEDEWLIESLLLKPGLMALSGNPGDFKTALALHFALSVIRGQDVFGKFPTQQGAVLMIDEESHIKNIKRRFEALGLKENDSVFYLSQNGIKVDARGTMDRIMALVQEHNITLVTFDSFVDVHGQEENDSGGTQIVLSAMRKLVKEGVSGLFLHHPAKRGDLGSSNTGQNLRGSSNILAQVDSHVYVAKKPGEEVLVLRHEKMRDGPKLNPFEVKIEFSDKLPSGFSFSGFHDEDQAQATEAAREIVEILRDRIMQSRKQLIDLLIKKFGRNSIDDGIKIALKADDIEPVPKDELPANMSSSEKKQKYYRISQDDDFPENPNIPDSQDSQPKLMLPSFPL